MNSSQQFATMNNCFNGQCHEKFCLWVFSTKHVPQPTDSYTKAFSNINSNSLRNSNLTPITRRGPLKGSTFFFKLEQITSK
jgi:hypothetical protein